MQIANPTVLQATASTYGSWFNIAHMIAWSLHVTGAEAGATFNVWVSNNPFIPTNGQADTFAVKLGTITPTNGLAMFQSSGVAHWVQIQKVAGGSPTASLVNLFGQIY